MEAWPATGQCVRYISSALSKLGYKNIESISSYAEKAVVTMKPDIFGLQMIYELELKFKIIKKK